MGLRHLCGCLVGTGDADGGRQDSSQQDHQQDAARGQATSAPQAAAAAAAAAAGGSSTSASPAAAAAAAAGGAGPAGQQAVGGGVGGGADPAGAGSSSSAGPSGRAAADNGGGNGVGGGSVMSGGGGGGGGLLQCPRFSYDEVLTMTKGFHGGHVLGEGGFGRVHRGRLPDGRDVAVKALNRGGLQGDHEFYVEASLLAALRHPNLVPLLGICDDGPHRVCVTEYMHRGSLRSRLDDRTMPMLWPERLRAALGAARGLEFLHHGTDPPIVHRDFKSANVLIDAFGRARVADFGLAKCLMGPADAPQRSIATVGTYGYIAPEYLEAGLCTTRADCYAFGVVLLELLTGAAALDPGRGRDGEHIVDWLRHRLGDARSMRLVLDPMVRTALTSDELGEACALAAACLQPTMAEVAAHLEDAVERYIWAHHTDDYDAIAAATMPPPLPPPTAAAGGATTAAASVGAAASSRSPMAAEMPPSQQQQQQQGEQRPGMLGSGGGGGGAPPSMPVGGAGGGYGAAPPPPQGGGMVSQPAPRGHQGGGGGGYGGGGGGYGGGGGSGVRNEGPSTSGRSMAAVPLATSSFSAWQQVSRQRSADQLLRQQQQQQYGMTAPLAHQPSYEQRHQQQKFMMQQGLAGQRSGTTATAAAGYTAVGAAGWSSSAASSSIAASVLTASSSASPSTTTMAAVPAGIAPGPSLAKHPAAAHSENAPAPQSLSPLSTAAAEAAAPQSETAGGGGAGAAAEGSSSSGNNGGGGGGSKCCMCGAAAPTWRSAACSHAVACAGCADVLQGLGMPCPQCGTPMRELEPAC